MGIVKVNSGMDGTMQSFMSTSSSLEVQRMLVTKSSVTTQCQPTFYFMSEAHGTVCNVK